MDFKKREVVMGISGTQSITKACPLVSVKRSIISWSSDLLLSSGPMLFGNSVLSGNLLFGGPLLSTVWWPVGIQPLSAVWQSTDHYLVASCCLVNTSYYFI